MRWPASWPRPGLYLGPEAQTGTSLALSGRFDVLEQVVNERMRSYDEVRRHSALENQPPCKFLERWLITVEEDRLSSEPPSRITPNHEIQAWVMGLTPIDYLLCRSIKR
jgi:hypothetical protein